MKAEHKAYFLGPKAENEAWVRAEFQAILDNWFGWRKDLFQQDPPAISHEESLSTDYLRARSQLAQALEDLNTMLEGELPTALPCKLRLEPELTFSI